MIEKPKKINTVALVANAHLDRKGLTVLKRSVNFLKKKEVEILYNNNAAKFLKTDSSTSHQIMSKADLIITYGGDGTLIKLARDTTDKIIPILAVNLGNVGFLTEIQKTENVISELERIWEKKYQLDVRSMLRITVYRKGKKVETFLALNEAVINQGNFARLIEMHAELNQRRMVRFKADGIIVSTPTGSTGHSLSAGGPIVHPKLDALVFTPICPSALAMRPIVIPSNRQVTIHIETQRRFKNNQIALTIDGQIVTKLEYGDQIKFRRSSRHFALVRMTNTRYYKMLREKLSWGD
ncbi:MAG: NAD(+)/NADH kinase [Candidatus Peregrinibacteria bacterium]|nr:NAD(+)/NADH kinase [Candidatus Peregrinibacteria bacterium]